MGKFTITYPLQKEKKVRLSLTNSGRLYRCSGMNSWGCWNAVSTVTKLKKKNY